MNKEDAKMTSIGHQVINLLNLKLDKNGQVGTDWGRKTILGLGRVINRIVNEDKDEQR